MEAPVQEELEALALDNEEEPQVRTILLLSKNKKQFRVTKAAASLSKFIETTMGDAEATEMWLQHIDDDTVEDVVRFMKYHERVPCRKIPRPLPMEQNLSELVDAFDYGFVDVEQRKLFKLLLAANYLDMKSLLYLVCAKVATMMQDKTPQEIRDVFQIRSDFTQEEKEEVQRKHADLLR